MSHVIRAGYRFDQYVYGLTSFIQNEHQEADVGEPGVAKDQGHKFADCPAASDSDDDDEVLTPADLKAIEVFLRGVAAVSLVESKTAVAPKVSASMARVHLPLVSDDDDG